MKVQFDIDLTPEEARTLLGLPNFQPVHDAITAKVQEKMESAMDDMTDPEYWRKTYFSLGAQGVEQFQKMMGGFAKAYQKSGRGKAKDETEE